MDALTLLRNDHKAVGKLLDQAKECDPGEDTLEALAEEIERALTVHAAIEEKFFYPPLKLRSEESEDTVDVFEAYTEHAVIKELIAMLKSGRQPDEQFKAEVQVLAENVTHHVKEEESTIFKLAGDLLDRDELESIGEKMEKEKNRMLRAADGAASRTKARPRKATAKRSAAKRPTAKRPAAKKTVRKKR